MKRKKIRLNCNLVYFLAIIIFSFAVLLPGHTKQVDPQGKLQIYSRQMNTQWREQRDKAEIRAIQEGIPVRKEYADGRVIELQRYWGDTPLYYTTLNLEAAQTVSTDALWPGGGGGFYLTGSGETLGVWDQGRVLTSHQEFEGRAVHMDNNTTLSDHATHVAGTMISAGLVDAARGMSYEALLHSYDWNSDLSEMAAEAANGMLVSNHSYGYVAGWFFDYREDGKWAWMGLSIVSETEDFFYGFYSDISAEWDNFAYNAPYFLPVVAAGNDRGKGPSQQPVEHWVRENGDWVLSSAVRQLDGGSDGFDCITHFSLAKNVLSVGAVSGIPEGYSKPSDIVMSSFSSWGPTDDGRIKPDIVAKGVGTYSASSSGNANYSFKMGTSMAAPNVAGSIGLLNQYYRLLYQDALPFSSTIKGLIIHTADAAGISNGPDYIHGWGLMNTQRAAEVMRNDVALGKNTLIRELSLSSGDVFNIQVQSDGSQPLKVTICWTDPAGTPISNIPASDYLNNPTPMLVNDLDLRVYGPDETEYKPWILDHTNPSQAAVTGDNYRDNVEQVYIINPVPGQHTIQVDHKGALHQGHQSYSLIVTGQDNQTAVESAVWTLY